MEGDAGMSVQRTLTGDEADDRRVPSTMLRCPECGESVLRSRRHDHGHDLSDADGVERAEKKELESKVPESARVETSTYRVEFTYECREVVTVEAEHKSEAKWKAKEERSYDYELVDTLHTRTNAWGEASAPTLEYLETHGLLPDDHDVTQADIEAVIDA